VTPSKAAVGAFSYGKGARKDHFTAKYRKKKKQHQNRESVPLMPSI
jgi:3-hydroxy-3-methylglutaryl CoA synthase